MTDTAFQYLSATVGATIGLGKLGRLVLVEWMEGRRKPNEADPVPGSVFPRRLRQQLSPLEIEQINRWQIGQIHA